MDCYYREGGIVTFEEYDSLPTELDSPFIYAVKNCDPPEYRVPIEGNGFSSMVQEFYSASSSTQPDGLAFNGYVSPVTA